LSQQKFATAVSSSGRPHSKRLRVLRHAVSLSPEGHTQKGEE
jgi:hypothetical protein